MDLQQQTKSRKKKKKPVIKIVIIIVLLVLLVSISVVYWYQSRSYRYKEAFFPNTMINGVDASNLTVQEVKSRITTGTEDYQLLVKGRKEIQEAILASEIDLHSVFDGNLERILSEQKPNEWFRRRKEQKDYEIQTMIAFDDLKLKDKIKKLSFFHEEIAEKPQDAYLSDYISGQGYSIVMEVEGAEVDYDKAEEAILSAIQNLKPELSLEEAGCYRKPMIYHDNIELNALAATLNRYLNGQVNYAFGNQNELVTSDMIHEWLHIQDDWTVLIDRDAVAVFVKSLAAKYNTAYTPKTLQTSYGVAVKISSGFYGWRINQTVEVEALIKNIQSGEPQNRQPAYLQTAASHGENDYGNTYVEINLTAQHLFFYKNGILVVESDFVSGNLSKGYDTPGGAFPLTYKQRNATLRGENYATPVSYWMPFNGNIGMHDASWRSSFGKNIYKTSGSHGCINLPPHVAKTIYEQIEAGMPVLCYHLEGTESAQGTGSKPETVVPESSVPETTIPLSPESTQPSAATQETNAGKVTESGQETEASVEQTVPAETTQLPKGPGGSGEIVESAEFGPGM